MKGPINMTTFYTVLGLIGAIMVAISLYGYRIETGKTNAERDRKAREERDKISSQVASSNEDLSKRIVTGEEKITKEIESGISEVIKKQDEQSEKIRNEIRTDKPGLNTARFSAQLQLVPFDTQSPSFTIKYLFHNYGVNPATEFSALLYIIPSDFSFNNRAIISSATEIAPKLGLSNTGRIGDYRIVENQIPVFFYIDLSYFDEIANKKLNQKFYFKWMGITNGNYSNQIEVVQAHEIAELKDYIDKSIK